MTYFQKFVSGVCFAFMPAFATAGILYQADSDPTRIIGGLCPTCAGTATTMGDYISLAGGSSKVNKLTWDTSNFGGDYSANIKLDFFNVDNTGTPALGSLIHTQTTSHFLAGGNGSSARAFVDITIPEILLPESFIYTISVVNNNGGTNWNVVGKQAETSADSDPSQAEASVGVNNELSFIFGDWVSDFGADTSSLNVGRLSMASYQYGLPQFADTYGQFTAFTPNVTIEGESHAVPEPSALALLSLGILGLASRRRKKA